MDLLQLFKLQKLDDRIAKNMTYNRKIVKRKMLALLVEIGELANETRCFKYWSNKPASEREVILEEYGGLHFILSIGIDLGIDKTSYSINVHRRIKHKWKFS